MTDTIGMIGLGVLGSAIAENLLKADIRLLGYDLDGERLETLAGLGMAPSRSAVDVVRQADILFTCLPTAAVLAEVVADIRTAGREGQVVVELSTLPIADKEAAHARLAESGITLLDIPVSGNRIMALRKGLTAFGSGDRAAYDRVEPILLTFCKKTHYVGPFGCGSKMKFVGNLLNLVHNSVAAEAMVLGMKSGLDPKLIHEVISGSGSSSAMFEVRGALMVDNDYRREGMNFSIPLKDSRIISAHAATLSCPTPIYQAALQSYYAAVAQGHIDEDQSAVCAAMERAANCERG